MSGAHQPSADRAGGPTDLSLASESQPEALIPCALEFIEWTRKVSEALAWQAGVGGMETAGSIISYLAKHPEQLEAFMTEGVFAFPIGWHEQGCLTWHAQNGKVVSPEFARQHRAIKRLEKGI